MSVHLTVIGAGPGGYVAAFRAAQMGARVTVIEQESVGGTCLNWGCIPSKIMLTTAELLDKFRRAGEFGIVSPGAAQVDMQQLDRRKEKIVQEQARAILNLFDHHKINYVRGRAEIDVSGRVLARSAEGSVVEVAWDRLILAPGTQPFEFPAFPFDGEFILSSNDVLCLKSIPESIIIVGGGVVGCEFAFILSVLGSQVTVVEALDRLLPLPSVDEDCSKVLHREMKKRKIRFLLKRTITSIDREGTTLRVTTLPSALAGGLTGEDRQSLTLEAEKVLVCVGRRPNTVGLGLEHLGIHLDQHGWVAADDRMATNRPNVYAIGDVLGPAKVMLAHVASAEGLVAAENAMGENRSMSYRVVPGAIFTFPEVADVGLTESQARVEGHNVRADRVLFRNLGKAQVIGEIAGEGKIISETGTGKLLGVHMIGPHATDLIAEAALALQMEATVTDLASTIHAHPTLAELMWEASFKALDRSMHG